LYRNGNFDIGSPLFRYSGVSMVSLRIYVNFRNVFEFFDDNIVSPT